MHDIGPKNVFSWSSHWRTQIKGKPHADPPIHACQWIRQLQRIERPNITELEYQSLKFANRQLRPTWRSHPKSSPALSWRWTSSLGQSFDCTLTCPLVQHKIRSPHLELSYISEGTNTSFQSMCRLSISLQDGIQKKQIECGKLWFKWAQATVLDLARLWYISVSNLGCVTSPWLVTCLFTNCEKK